MPRLSLAVAHAPQRHHIVVGLIISAISVIAVDYGKWEEADCDWISIRLITLCQYLIDIQMTVKPYPLMYILLTLNKILRRSTTLI